MEKARGEIGRVAAIGKIGPERRSSKSHHVSAAQRTSKNRDSIANMAESRPLI
jgi:hypothetical protein